jgi:hypothetical protein
MRQQFLSRLRLPHSQPDIIRKIEEATEMCFVKHNQSVKHRECRLYMDEMWVLSVGGLITTG